MKRNLWKFRFVLLGFFILFSIFSCNNIISPKKATQVSFNLDISGLQETHQNQANFLNSRVAEGSISHISISLYQVTDSVSVSENQELDISKLTLLESITPSVAPDGKVLATFNEVTVGIDAVIFVEIYELTDANEKILAYKGNSPIFTVHEGENNEEIELKKVDGQNQEVKQEFTVTFDANGGSFADGSLTQQITVEEGTPATAPETEPTYQGHIFDFWATRQEDGGLSQYEFSQPVTGNLTLYAQWRAQNQVASVKFNPATSTVDYNTGITLSCDTTDATIYYTTDGSDPTTSSTKQTYLDTPITITQKTTIKAYAVKSDMTASAVTEITYSLNQYTVQFVLNEGSFTDGKATSLTVTSGGTVTLTDYVPTKSGFNFGGWYFDTSLQEGADSRVIPNKDNTTSGTLTLYAKWEVVNNSITSFADLKSAITSASETIHVAGNFEISETLTISSATTIIADEPTTFTRATGFTTGALFTNSADFTLQGSENAIITINGNDIEASAPAIKSTANLTVTYCNFENNTNKATDGGAIYVNTDSEVTLTASNCNFTNNKVTGAIKAGGAVAIDGNLSSSSFIDCKFESNMTSNLNGSDTYGGAIYLDGDITTNGKWYGFTNCIFTNNSCVASKNYGGAIYLSRGSLSLNNVTMTGNTWDTGTSNKPSDILAETTSSNLKLDGSIQINSLEIPPKDPPKNLALADTFDTTSIIQISIDSSQSSLFKVVTYDSIGSTNTTTTLTPEQIACFTSIEDSNGVQYTLNDNGTISTQ